MKSNTYNVIDYQIQVELDHMTLKHNFVLFD